jgi:hypothetical protein
VEKKQEISSMKKIALLFLCLLLHIQANAEIQDVTVMWRGALCDRRCVDSLYRLFKQIRPIASVTIDPQAGKAHMIYKPGSKFEFQPINYAMRRIGLSLRDIRVRIRGTISHTGDTLFINSLGDTTRFALIGFPEASRQRYVVPFSRYNRPLEADVKRALLFAEANHQLVTIEGPIFEPYGTDMILVVEKYDVQQDTKNNY